MAAGVTVRPIRDLAGGEHFNEVYLDDVRLDADALIGTEGQGWEQVTAELAFERSGPERFLSSMALLHTLIDAVGAQPDALQAHAVGRLSARLVVRFESQHVLDPDSRVSVFVQWAFHLAFAHASRQHRDQRKGGWCDAGDDEDHGDGQEQ